MYESGARRLLAGLLIVAVLSPALQARAAEDFPPLPAPAPEVYLDRSGFGELVYNQMMFGQQVGLALTFGLFDDPLRQVSGLFLGAGAGILLPIALTLDKPIPSGHVAYINNLQRAGAFSGLLLFGLVQPQMSSEMDFFRAAMLYSAAGGLLGLGASLLTMNTLELMPGQATAIGAGYWYGMFTGAMLLAMFDVVSSQEAFFGTMLAFSGAGMVTTFLLRDHFRVNRSRIIWTTVGALVGASVGGMFAVLVGGSFVAPPLVYGGTLLGFWGGAALTFTRLVPSDSFRNRANLEQTSLLGVDSRGRVSLGVPLPSLTVLPAASAGDGPKMATTLGILEWRP